MRTEQPTCRLQPAVRVRAANTPAAATVNSSPSSASTTQAVSADPVKASEYAVIAALCRSRDVRRVGGAS
jgi:hypothetical protein